MKYIKLFFISALFIFLYPAYAQDNHNVQQAEIHQQKATYYFNQAEQYERERAKLSKLKAKKSYTYVSPDTNIEVFSKSDRRLREILTADPWDVDNSANDLALVRKICYYYNTADLEVVRDVFAYSRMLL